LSAASHVQVVAVVEACSNYLQVWLMSMCNREHFSIYISVYDTSYRHWFRCCLVDLYVALQHGKGRGSWAKVRGTVMWKSGSCTFHAKTFGTCCNGHWISISIYFTSMAHNTWHRTSPNLYNTIIYNNTIRSCSASNNNNNDNNYTNNNDNNNNYNYNYTIFVSSVLVRAIGHFK
jgi:hypothetical protein